MDECKPLVSSVQPVPPCHHGRAVQVDPIKPTLKSPGAKRLKLICDDPLSNFAFNFNLRRYNTVLDCFSRKWRLAGAWGFHSSTSQLNVITWRSNNPRTTSTHHRLISCQHSARGLHSSTSQLNVRTFCRIRRAPSVDIWVITRVLHKLDTKRLSDKNGSG